MRFRAVFQDAPTRGGGPVSAPAFSGMGVSPVRARATTTRADGRLHGRSRFGAAKIRATPDFVLLRSQPHHFNRKNSREDDPTDALHC